MNKYFCEAINKILILIYDLYSVEFVDSNNC